MPGQAPNSSSSGDSARLARGAGLVLGGRFLGRGTGYLLQLLIGKVLGPAGYGLYAIGFNVALLASLVFTLGLEHGVIRFGARGGGGAGLRGVVGRALSIATGSGVLSALLLVLGASWLAEDVFGKPGLTPVFQGFALLLLARPLLQVAAAATRVTQEMRHSVLAEDLGQPLIQLVLLLALFALGWRLHGAVLATSVSFLLALCLAFLFLVTILRRMPERPDAPAPVSAGALLSFSLPAAMAGMLGAIAMWVDRLLVGYFLSEADTGVYQAASQVSLVFVLILSSFNSIFAPMIADLLERGASQRLDALYKIGTKWGLYLGLPVFLVICTVPSELVALFYDSRFLEAVTPMLVLAAGQLANLCTGAVGFLLIMSGRQRVFLLVAGASLVVNLGLNILWIPRFGLLGAALATATAVTVLFGSALGCVRGMMGLWPFDRRYLKGGAAALVTLGVLLGVRSAGVLTGGSLVVAECVLAALCFFGTLLLLGLDREDRELAEGLLRRLRRA